jgi:heme o synthase
MFVPLGVGGTIYLISAIGSGALFLAQGIKGLRADSAERWARSEFVGSLAYLTVLLAVLLIDRPPGLWE